MRFGNSDTFFRKWLRLAEHRYFRVFAEKNSQYRIMVRSDEMITHLEANQLRYSSLAVSDNHYYVHPMDTDTVIDVEFELKNVLNLNFPTMMHFLES